MQRRLMYFPTGWVPTSGEIGLTEVEPVTFETTDGLGLSGWFVAASGPSPRVTVLLAARAPRTYHDPEDSGRRRMAKPRAYGEAEDRIGRLAQPLVAYFDGRK